MTRLSVLAAAMLAGCAAIHPAAGPPPPIPPFPALAPDTYGGTAHVAQILSVAYGATEAQLQCFVDVTPDRDGVLCLTALGQRVFKLGYDGTTLEAKRSALAPDAIDPRRVLADIELAFWPIDALRKVTHGSPWSITAPAPGVRRIRYGRRLYAETHANGSGAWPHDLWLANLAYGYTLRISTQPATR